MATEHIINIIGDISDVEAKIRTVERMLSQLKQEFREVSQRVPSASGSGAKSTAQSRRAANVEQARAKSAEKLKRVQGIINTLSEEELQTLRELNNEFLKYDRRISGTQRRIRSLANSAGRDFEKLVQEFARLDAEGQRFLLNQARTLNRTMPDVRNRINQTINAIARYRDTLRSVGRVRAAEAIDLSAIESNLANRQLHELNDIVSRVRLNTTRLNKQMKSTPLSEFQQRLGKITSWMGAVWTLFGAIAAAQAAVQTISDMEKAIVDLRKVMDEATTDFGKMREEIFDLAKAFGQLPREVANAMFLFARQGRDQAEVLELTRVALMGVNIAELNTEEAVTILTAAMNQLNAEASEAIVLLDSWNEVSNKNAVSTKDLGDAFRFSASLANSLGLSIHELNALVTILAANTGKAGSEIGRTLRFAFTRSFTPAVLDALGSVGIAVTDINGNMRDFSAVLRDIGDRWEEFSDITRQRIAFAFGGTRHVNDMRILFENLTEDGIRIATESMNSFGSASRENLKYMQSLERQFQSLIASVQELITAVGDSGLLAVLKGGIDVLKLVVNLFNEIPAPVRTMILSFGLAKAAGFALSTVMGKLGISLTAGSQIASSFTTRIASMSLNVGTLIASVGGLSGALTKLFGLVMTFLGPWGKLAGAILLAATAYNKLSDYMALAEDRAKARISTLVNLRNAEQATYRQLLEIRDQINTLNDSSLSENELNQKKAELYQKFNKILPNVAKNYGELENVIDKVIEKQRMHVSIIERSSQRTIEGFVTRNVRAAEAQLDEAERQQKALEEIVQRFYTDRFFGPTFVLDELARNELVGNLQAYVDQLKMAFMSADEVLALIENRFEEAQARINQKIADAERRVREAEALSGTGPDQPFPRDATTALADPNQERINRFGEYLVAVQDFVASERELATALSEFFEGVDRNLEESETILENMEKLFDNTGKGLSRYITSLSKLNREHDELLKRNQRIARTLLDDQLSGFGHRRIIPGTEEYFNLLKKIAEIEEQFNERMEEKRKALDDAWDAGVLSATEYLVQLRKIEESRAFERQREKVREMMEALKSGTEGAFTDAIKSMLKGEEDAIEKFQESLADVRLGVFAEGLSSLITNSNWFQTQITRQQNALAQLFGGSPQDFRPLEEKQFEIQKKTEENTADAATTLGDIRDRMEDIRDRIEKFGLPPAFPFGSEGLIGLLGLLAGEIKKAVEVLKPLAPTAEQVGEALGNAAKRAKEALSGLGEKAKEVAKKFGSAGDSVSEIVTSLGSLTVPDWGAALDLPPVPGWNQEILQLPSIPEWSGTLQVPEGLVWENGGLVPLPQPTPLSWEKQTVPVPSPAFEWDKTILPLPLLPPPTTMFQWQEVELALPSLEPVLAPFKDAVDEWGTLLDGASVLIKDSAITALLSFTNSLVGFYSALQSSSARVQSETPAPTGIAGFRQAEGESFRKQAQGAQQGSWFSQMWQAGTNWVSTQWQEMFGAEARARRRAEFLEQNPHLAKDYDFNSASGIFQFLADLAKDSVKEGLKDVVQDPKFWIMVAGVIGPAAIPLAQKYLTPAQMQQMQGALQFAKGGYTGDGPISKPAGIVHAGEYVVPAWMVQKYGDLIAMLENIRLRGYQTGGMAGASGPSPRRRNPALNPFPNIPATLEYTLNVLFDGLFKLGMSILGTIKPFEQLQGVIESIRRPFQAVLEFMTGSPTARRASEGFRRHLVENLGFREDIADVYAHAVEQGVKFGFGTVNLFGTALSAAAGFTLFDDLKKFSKYSIADLFGFSSGGFTGKGGISEFAGFVHKGEYVVPAWQVRKYPRLIEMLEGIRKRGYQRGGYVLTASFDNPSPTKDFVLKLDNESLGYLKAISENTEEFKLQSSVDAFGALGSPQQATNFWGMLEHFFQGVMMGFGVLPPGAQIHQALKDAGLGDEELKAIKPLFEEGVLKETFGRIPTMAEITALAKGIQAMGPSAQDLTNAAQFWNKELGKVLENVRETDKVIIRELRNARPDIKTVGQALTDPRQIQNAVAAFMEEMGRPGGTGTSAKYAALAGLVANTGIPAASGFLGTLSKRNIRGDVGDVIRGIGQLFAGFEQNIAQKGSGIANVLTGIMNMTGIGGALTPFLGLLFQSMFGPKEEAKEAEKITNVRRFIATDDGLGMPDRFFLSGRHANLLATGGGGGDTTININEGAIQVQGVDNPREAAVEVLRQLEAELPKKYSRGLQRGLTRM